MRDFPLPQLRLGLRGFLFCDVGDHPAELIPCSLNVGMRTSPNPAHLAIWVDNTNIGSGGLAALQNRLKPIHSNTTVLGVDRRQKRLTRERSVACKAKHRPTMFGGQQFVGGSIVLPQP